MAINQPDNLHTVYMSGQPLGVECKCGRRMLLGHAQLGGCKGDMTSLPTLAKRLRCLGCGARNPKVRAFINQADRAAFEQETDRPGPRF